MEKPDGLKRLRESGHPWLSKTADLIEEMAEDLEWMLEEHQCCLPPNESLKKYKEWK